MIKILLVTQTNHTGLTYHRQLVPHMNLEQNYAYQVIPCTDINSVTDEQLKDFHIVSFLRLIDSEGKSVEIIKRCKKAGCKVIIDIDDYWFLHPKHALNQLYKEKNIAEQTVDGLREADCVTTTTEFFAAKIRQINPQTIVLPNAIDPTEKQFKSKHIYSDKLRIGWIGGIYHEQDIRLLYEGFNEVYKDVNNDLFQFCLGGFNLNESYKYMEAVFTNNFKNIKNKQYIELLKQYMPIRKDIEETQPYRRLYGKSVFEYATLYNELDVNLVPLYSNNFNSYKSQIKIIEAGFFKKACIVSNVMPYTIDCTNNNTILVNPTKRNDGWGTAIKSLIKNPNRIEDLGEALYETVKDKYNINTVNVLRNQLYQELCSVLA